MYLHLPNSICCRKQLCSNVKCQGIFYKQLPSHSAAKYRRCNMNSSALVYCTMQLQSTENTAASSHVQSESQQQFTSQDPFDKSHPQGFSPKARDSSVGIYPSIMRTASNRMTVKIYNVDLCLCTPRSNHFVAITACWRKSQHIYWTGGSVLPVFLSVRSKGEQW